MVFLSATADTGEALLTDYLAGNIDEALGGGSPLSSLLSGGISATKSKIAGGGGKGTFDATDAADVRKAVGIDMPDVKTAVKDIDVPDVKTATKVKEPIAGTQQGNIRSEIKADTQTAFDVVEGDAVLVSSIENGYGKSRGGSKYQSSIYSGEEWCRYFRETYGNNNVTWENATPSQLARSWQGEENILEWIDISMLQ